MKRNKKNTREKDTQAREHPLPGDIEKGQKEQNRKAYVQAENDIENDAEFSAHNKNDDLDEGESARLGEDRTDLV